MARRDEIKNGTVQYNLMSKDNTLVFRPSKSPNGKPLEARILEDIRINPDIRINALLVSAPSESMELLQALINEMDVPPLAKAEIRVFQLKKTDAAQFANMLRTLFLGTTTTGTTTPAAGPGPAGPGAGRCCIWPCARTVTRPRTAPPEPPSSC